MVAMQNTLFGDVPGCVGLAVYRGHKMIARLDAHLPLDAVREYCEENGVYGALRVQPVTRAGALAEPCFELSVMPPDADPDASDAVAATAERMSMTRDAQRRLDEAAEARISALVDQERAKMTLQLQQARADAATAQMEAAGAKAEVQALRDYMQQRIQSVREESDLDARRLRDQSAWELKCAKDGAALDLERLKVQLEGQHAAVLGAAKLQLEAALSEARRLDRDNQDLRRRLQTALDESADKQREALNRESELKAKVASRNDPAVARATELREIASAMGSADPATREFLTGILQAEHGIAGPGKVEQIATALLGNEHVQHVIANVIARFAADQPANALPAPAKTTVTTTATAATATRGREI